jgi:hypothetical protein
MKIRIHLRSVVVRLFLILSISTVLGCSTPPQTASGRRLKLETIRHEDGIVYLYRPVEQPSATVETN